LERNTHAHDSFSPRARVARRGFVWAGGALFVTSLAWCAWWYLWRLGASSPAGGWTALVADIGWLTAFALHHSVFAREPVKRRLTRWVPAALERSVYVWIASVLLILVCALWRPIGGTLYDAGGWRAAVHAALQIFGVWLIAKAVAGIDPLELAGIREQATRGELQTAGPYGWVRHPLYLGWVMAVFGAGHLTGDRLAFAAITTIYLMIAVLWEERSLVKSFGEEYRRYQRQVRWKIVPYVF
jgi:protein-S-isoprenylcysteine O-methyltransferase Ste14